MLITIEDLDKKNTTEKREIASKLHKRFGHPIDSQKLKDFLRNAGIVDNELNKHLDTVTDDCNTCLRYRKTRSRPIVSIPLANDFNE